MFFSVVLLHLKDSPLTSIVLDSAATKFTPEIPEVSCGLKQFTHPSIGIVVRWVNYPFTRPADFLKTILKVLNQSHLDLIALIYLFAEPCWRWKSHILEWDLTLRLPAGAEEHIQK